LSLIAILLLLTTGLTIAVVGTAPFDVTKGPPELVALKQAAEAGDSESQYEIGVLYEHGTGVSDHLVQAYCWYVRAAAQGNERAARQRDALMKQLSPAEIVSCQTSAGTTRVAARDHLGIASDFAAPIRLAQDPELPPPVPRLAAEPAETYQDALIDPNIPADPAYGSAAAGEPSNLLPGSGSAEYRYYRQNTSGAIANTYTENGVSVEARQETRSLGRIEARGTFTTANNEGIFGNQFDGGNYANLTQRDFALTDRWLMTNELGHLRARVPELLSQGYRIRLPEPLLQGLSSETRSADTTVRVGGGTLGTYQGRTFPVFSTAYSSGSAAGASASTRFNANWQGSAQFWQMNDADTGSGVRSFSSTAGAVRYTGADQTSAQANVLWDSDGPLGLWFDGARRFGAWLNNAGLYRMDRDLTWIDRNNLVQSDIEGVYWRGNTRSYRTSYSVGADWSRTNIANDATLPTRTNTYGFGNVGYLVDPTFSVNGFLSLGQDNVDSPGASTRDTNVVARGSGSKRFAIGTSSVTLGVTDRSGDSPYTRTEGNWDHYWNPVGGFSALRTGIAYINQTNSSNDFAEAQLRGSLGWAWNRITLGANAYLGYQTADTIDSSRTTSVTANFGWQVADAWRVGADLTYNHNALQVTNGAESRVTDKQVLVSVRYDANWGRPESTMGVATGKLGRGAVRGVLFYDKNGNGLRDAGEQGVPNVTIYLDRGFSVETNANGEFSFDPVASGQHEVSVNVANIPLPWVIDENRRIWADVRPRESAVVEIPLIRIGPN
jgi:hypothetical protein